MDGLQTVVVTARHAAYQDASDDLTVSDWEPLTLSLSASTLPENNGTAIATISRPSTDASQPVTITLQSSDTSELVVTATVTIPINQTSISVVVTVSRRHSIGWSAVRVYLRKRTGLHQH